MVSMVTITSATRIRCRRLTQEVELEPNIIGDVDKAIFRLDYLFARFNKFHHWFALSMALIMVLRFPKTGLFLPNLAGMTTVPVVATYALRMLICKSSIWFGKKYQALPEKKS